MPWFLCAFAALPRDGVQTVQTVPEQNGRSQEIIVTGRRGAADVPPQIEIDADAIDALSADDIGEVIRRATRNYALGDEPVVIVNGRRVADPGVFSGFPPDALVRVEVLPPGAGARYGSDPSRRVVNIVLQRHFKSRDGEFEAKAPTAGGMSNLIGDLRQGGISGNSTTQFSARATRDSALLGGERPQYLEDHPGTAAVSLRPSAETVAANMTMTRPLGTWSSSLNVQAQQHGEHVISRLNDASADSRNTTRSLLLIGGLNGTLMGWSLQASLTGQLAATNQSGVIATDSRQQSLVSALAVNRGLFKLPAGPVIVNLSTQASLSRTTSRTAGTRQAFSAHDRSLSGTLSLPLWQGAAPGSGTMLARMLGTMSATLGGSLRQTDTGQGRGLNAGLAWAALNKFRLTGNWSTSIDSLSDRQRFAPKYYGAPVIVFDFATGQSAEVLPILGGTPGLRPPRFDQVMLSAMAGPFSPRDLVGSITLQRSHAVDSIGTLPAVTPELEAAFPDRFQRGDKGQLIAIDQRPLNFASALTDSLSSNLSATFPLGDAAANGRRGTLGVTINHGWQLRDATIIHAGLPKMNRLAGDGGGTPRQQLDVQIDGRLGRWGMNMAARWHSGYRIRRDSGRNSPDDLLVAAIGTMDLQWSYALERVRPVGKEGAPPRRSAGVQFGLEVDNLFDTRPNARLGSGGPAPGYRRDDQDPVGRTIRLTIRNRF